MPVNELHSRKLHFSVYDFDRFSRHDLIGQVVVDNLLDFSEGSGEKPIWRDIVEGTAVGKAALRCLPSPLSHRLSLQLSSARLWAICGDKRPSDPSFDVWLNKSRCGP